MFKKGGEKNVRVEIHVDKTTFFVDHVAKCSNAAWCGRVGDGHDDQPCPDGLQRRKHQVGQQVTGNLDTQRQ